jgi:hypothetical protein
MANKWPLNTDGRTWALEEIEKLNKQNEALKNALSNKPPDVGPPEPDPRQQKLRALLQGLYDAHVQCEGYDPNNPAVQEVQRELGII